MPFSLAKKMTLERLYIKVLHRLLEDIEIGREQNDIVVANVNDNKVCKAFTDWY